MDEFERQAARCVFVGIQGTTPAPAELELVRRGVGAVLLFRALTYGLQVPLGGFTYIIWRRKKSWFKTPPDLEPSEEHPVAPMPVPVLAQV